MKNIRFLKQHVDKLETTEFAVFFEHDGFFARLDWSIHDSADVTDDHIQDLMLEQMANDLADDWVIENIRERNAKSTTETDESVQRFLNDGFVEEAATEFKLKAIERFGDK